MAQVQEITLAEAAQGLGRCMAVSDFSVSEMGEGAFAFRLAAPGGGGVFILQIVEPARLWIAAAEGRAAVDLSALGTALVEGIARACRCTEIAFETRRRGLAAKAARLGFAVERVLGKSIVMKKEI